MRTDDEYRQILLYWEQGNDQSHIARLTGIPRGTDKDCIKRFGSIKQFNEERSTKPKEPFSLMSLEDGVAEPHIEMKYAYLLGMYLGDGYINKEPRTYKIRISLDSRYQNIIQVCVSAIETLLPDNQVYVLKKPYNCVEVTCYNSYWPAFFPQHGSGKKHERLIELESWQKRIAETHPIELIRGLYHSDGSRSKNIVKGKDYPRYEFKNNSDDIRRFFSNACDLLGLHWTTSSNGLIIQIAKRSDVTFLDQHIGPKS